MAGDDSGPGVCCERDDSVSGLSQDGAGFLTTQDPLRREERRRGQEEAKKKNCKCESRLKNSH